MYRRFPMQSHILLVRTMVTSHDHHYRGASMSRGCIDGFQMPIHHPTSGGQAHNQEVAAVQ